MKVDDFYDLKPGNRARNTKNITLPKLCEIVEVKFVEGSRMMYFKRSHDTNEYEEVEFLKSRFPLVPFPEKLHVPRGVTSKKKEGILRILGHALKRKYYGDLFVNDSAEDLVTQFDV